MTEETIAENEHGESRGLDDLIGGHGRLLVKQVKEWGEIVLGFESANRYEIFDDAGEPVGFAAEEAGGLGRLLARNFFGALRSCRLHIYDRGNQEIARGDKPFRFYFHRMDVYEGGEKLGAIRRKFSILHRRFIIEDASGEDLLEIKSPFLRIWTFKLLLDDREVGRISKRWGGMLKEMFSDADIFGIEFSHEKLPLEIKKLLVLATFLIDFVCFENNQGRGGLVSWGD